MRPDEPGFISEVGKRVTLSGLTLERRTFYERHEERCAPGQNLVVWRHAFRTAEGHLVVYSGNMLPLKVGQIVTLRATIKAHDFAYQTTRVQRPVIVEDTQCAML